MSGELARFHEIADRLTGEQSDVSQGRMMSSPGLAPRGKYFAFIYDSSMVFRLGKEVESDSLGLAALRLLNPYKTKPPVAGWFVVDDAEQDRWEDLARLALERMEAELAGMRVR